MSLKLITLKATCSITLAAGMGTRLCGLRKRVVHQSKEIMALNVPDVLLFISLLRRYLPFIFECLQTFIQPVS